jgi:hypothetical protein
MALDDQDPEISETDLEAMLAERGLKCSPADRQGILAVARFLQQAAGRVRRYESEASASAQKERMESENEEAAS